MLPSSSIQKSMLPLKYPWSNRWGKAQKLFNNPNPFDIYRIFMSDDGEFPNNRDYPALIYKDAFDGTEAEGRELIVGGGDWTEPWVWGIFSYHHYHTKAWELLLCTHGSASVQFGGDCGPIIAVATGDLILIPPGMAHIQLDEQNGFRLLGSYPTKELDGEIDTLRGRATKDQKKKIKMCHVPDRDPVFNLDLQMLCSMRDD